MVIRSHQQLREMLEKEHERLLAQLEHENSWADDHIGYGIHMADDGTEAFEQAVDLSMRTRLEDTLSEVQESLRRFEQGTYGVCEECGIEIDWARLEARPYAKFCIKCQQKRDFKR